MPQFPYDEETTPQEGTPEPKEETASLTGETSPEGAEGEFDISSFDFNIADPGEIKEYSELKEAAEGSKESSETEKKGKFSLSKLSAMVSEKAEKLMEETPKEPKIREKREKPKKERKPLFRTKEKTAVAAAEFGEKQEEHRGEKIRFTGGSFRQVSRRWLRYALRPSALYDGVTELLAPLFLAGVMFFFGGFYLLIGLDWYFADLISMGRLWAFVAVGLLVGGTAAMMFSAGVQGLSLICRKERIRPFRVVSTVAGACVYPASLLILGLLIQLIFRASVSMSFGITAVLWLISLLLDILRDLFGEKNLFKSSVLIVLWGFLLFVIMTLTFSLK